MWKLRVDSEFYNKKRDVKVKGRLRVLQQQKKEMWKLRVDSEFLFQKNPVHLG